MKSSNAGKSTALRVLSILVIILLSFAGVSQAQTSAEMRTVFTIGSINGVLTWPLRAYSVSVDQLIPSETWRPTNRDGGPVGLAVDPINERMFISYEFSGTLDVFDATDATPLGQITLVSPDPLNPVDDIAGMDVHEGRGLLYVADRAVNYVYVFDTDTFENVETWELPTSNGIWDVEIIEGVSYLGDIDAIFTTDATNTIHWYDIDTHEEVGTAYQTVSVALGLGVYMKDSGYPVLFSSTVSGSHSPPDSVYLSRFDVETGAMDSVNMGGTGRGIEAYQRDGYIYVTVGSTLVSPASVRVYEQESLQELSRADYTFGWSPCDVKATWLAFGSSVKKECTSHPDGQINMTDDVTFTITVTNKYSRPIHILPLKDTYDTTQLTFVSSTPPVDDPTDDGEVGWADLVPIIGHDLAYLESYTVTLNFKAEPEGCTSGSVEGQNVALMSNAEDDTGSLLEDASGSFSFDIWCNCVTDADCDDGVYCNGTETCVDLQCKPGVNPCPIDDGLWCNGEETLTCIEASQECGHTGSPCKDDGNLCNGTEGCDEEGDLCTHTGDPCVDDGLWCNGAESCDPTQIDCQHSGSPCTDAEKCNEETDECDPFNVDDDTEPAADDEEAGWPEGNVTGGCCGCGE